MHFNIYTALSAWICLVLLIFTIIKLKKPTKSIKRKFPEEIQPIIDDLEWYFDNCIDGKQIDNETSSAFDNISEFYVKRFGKMHEGDQIKFFRILFTYQPEIHDYVNQVRDDMAGTGVYKNDNWYQEMSNLFIDVYRDTLKIAFKYVAVNHTAEFNNLDFVKYQDAINQIDLWAKQSNFNYKKQLGDN